MAFTTPTVAAVLFALAVLYAIKRLVRSKSSDKPLPPGPKGIPFLGNVNDLPKPGMLECHHWLKHKDLYGPISSLTVLGQTFVIINDAQMALELLRDRSSIYSSRPHQVFSCDMVGWNNATALSPYGEYLKIHRKGITKIAGSSVSVSAFNRVQEVEAAHFLLNMLDSPEGLFDHIRTEAGSVILKITYGYTAESHGRDPLVDLAGKTMEDFAEATVPGKYAVDVLPFLRFLPDWCPGTGFKRTARRMAAQLRRTADQPYAYVKQQMSEKKHKTSFLSQAIENAGSDAEMEYINKWVALSMYLGGADTTVSSLMTFFLTMTLFPEVQRAAQAELDRVIGNSRLPVIADRERLPYLEALLQETHRWHPVAPMGLPHVSTAEDTCNGYRIPKGALLLPNTWLFTHDPAVYPNPMEFRPERYLTNPPAPDPRTWIFGFGRRICPGRFVADNALFITMAQTLAVFNIEKAVEGGKTVEPKVEFEPGMISHPLPFRTAVKPRSEAHAELIRAAEKEYPWEQSDAKALETVRW